MPRLSKIGAAALAAFGWTSGSSVSADFLVVAGGGGGATAFGAGGGAGGFRTSAGPSGGGASAETKLSLNPTLSYTVIVGAGGNGALGSTQANNTNGSNSSISTITSTGGGAGGTNGSAGATGGSGGAGGNQGGISAAAGAGTANQGFAGGTGSGSSSYGSGGGGGAGGIGGTGTTSVCGDGGVGVPSSISGTSTYYAGGGGGGATSVFGITTAGLGGNGGGGSGSNSASSWVGYAGEANKGGGGGGGGYTGTWQNGGQGGSGVVIISYVGAQQFGGGVVTSSGGNTIHTFTTSGTLSPLSSLTANYLIVAGGGGGAATFGGGYGGGGGGGAGGLLSGSGVTIDTNSIYAVTVGASGAGGASAGAVGTNGGNSTFSMVTTTAVGGGGGASYPGATGVGNGGSGGGVGYGGGTIASGGTGISGQGFAGGGKVSAGSGGGGGASSVGGNGSAGGSGTFPETGGNGGSGLQNPITGSTTGQLSGGIYYVAGGGGGGGYENGGNGLNGGTASAGGGAGGGSAVAGSAGTASTGGGGGGGGGANLGTHYNGGNGGSGVVIISYPGSTQQMAGGTVTVAGGNVIHTFTSSGYLTPIVLVNNSLRFRASVNAYLNRTFRSGNQQIFTYSLWIKRGSLGASRNIFSCGSSGTSYFQIRFNSDETLLLASENGGSTPLYLNTTQVFRDPSAWYHIVFAIDTTQATSTNTVKVYVNGTQVTAFNSTTYPPQNTSFLANSAITHYIGDLAYSLTAQPFDGYLADVNFIDGQALTPNSFGTSNGLGVWQPIRYGGSYGTNGFYLPFNAGTSTFVGSYNGSTTWFNAANNAAFAFGTGSLTIEAWVYPTQNSYGAIFDTRSTGSSGPGVSIYANSGNGIILVNNTTYNPSTYLSLNQWSHIAAVRNGASSWTVYINGNSVLTFTDSSNLTDNACFSGKNYAGTFFFGGAISNLRVVKGTAVYTSNFTLPTSPLTNISGTSLLTLQNSTLIDNSTNAFSLTNTGPVTLGTSYPFSAARIFNDQSPQGNNWTPNNISGITGTTLDYMTDVPTLTSATTANYAVINPLIPSTNTISNGNLKVSASTSPNSKFVSTIGVTSGKYYMEIVASTWGSAPIGASTNTTPQAYLANSDGSTSVAFWGGPSGTQLYLNAVLQSWSGSSTTWATNDVAGLALDATAKTIALYKNGSLVGTYDYSALGWNEVYFAGGNYISSLVYECNFGQQPFSYTAPTGFVALNTFNLPTPTIGATASTTANKYMDVVLHNGNGGSQSITGLNFAPDFWWVKSRNILADHCLFDQIRGANSSLFSDLTLGENNNWTGQSFNSNGVTADAAYSYQTNGAGYTFVDWFWKANGAGSSNTQGSIISTVSANTTAGFSIVTYTGNATSGATVGHGCQVGGIATAPSMVILKSRSLTTNWYVYHSGLTSAAYQVYLNLTSGQDNSVTTAFNSVAPGATTFTLPGTGFGSNNSGATYVAYCFAQIAGYSAFGSYTGNGSADGPFVFTGFRPRFVMIKNTSAVGSWEIQDTSRAPSNVMNAILQANTSSAEITAGRLDGLSNGFKLRTASDDLNTSGSTYIYMAFAESPFKFSNAR